MPAPEPVAAVLHSGTDQSGAHLLRDLLTSTTVPDVDDHHVDPGVPVIGLWSADALASSPFLAAMSRAHERYALVSVTTSHSVALPVRFRSTQVMSLPDLVANPDAWGEHLARHLTRARGQLLAKPVAELSDAELKTLLAQGVPRRGLDLAHRTLAGLDLSGRYLAGANLMRAQVSGCSLHSADLVGANLERCRLSDGDVSRADLSLANLWHTSFSNVRGIDTCSLVHANVFGGETGFDLTGRLAISRGSYAAYLQHFTGNLGFTRGELHEWFPWLTHPYFQHLLR